VTAAQDLQQKQKPKQQLLQRAMLAGIACPPQHLHQHEHCCRGAAAPGARHVCGRAWRPQQRSRVRTAVAMPPSRLDGSEAGAGSEQQDPAEQIASTISSTVLLADAMTATPVSSVAVALAGEGSRGSSSISFSQAQVVIVSAGDSSSRSSSSSSGESRAEDGAHPAGALAVSVSGSPVPVPVVTDSATHLSRSRSSSPMPAPAAVDAGISRSLTSFGRCGCGAGPLGRDT
jgi:hypothetical protein